VWKRNIPRGTDVVVTHGPARGHGDGHSQYAGGAGCVYLLRELRRVRPRLHVCGHIHRARGVEHVDWNLVQWGYDDISMGKGGVVTLAIVLGVWVWSWVMCGIGGGRRERRMTFVNAAVEGTAGRLVEGEETIVVEM
jgi:hypothetical protein